MSPGFSLDFASDFTSFRPSDFTSFRPSDFTSDFSFMVHLRPKDTGDLGYVKSKVYWKKPCMGNLTCSGLRCMLEMSGGTTRDNERGEGAEITIKHAQPKSAVPLREVLYQFAMAKDVPDVDLLDEFVRQYPQHAEALTDFAVELVVDSLQDNRHEVRRIIMEATRTDCIERCLNNIRSALLDLERLKADRSLSDGDKPDARSG